MATKKELENEVEKLKDRLRTRRSVEDTYKNKYEDAKEKLQHCQETIISFKREAERINYWHEYYRGYLDRAIFYISLQNDKEQNDVIVEMLHELEKFADWLKESWLDD